MLATVPISMVIVLQRRVEVDRRAGTSSFSSQWEEAKGQTNKRQGEEVVVVGAGVGQETEEAMLLLDP